MPTKFSIILRSQAHVIVEAEDQDAAIAQALANPPEDAAWSVASATPINDNI